MGSSSSTPFSYDAQLLEDTKEQSQEIQGQDDSKLFKDGLAGVPRTGLHTKELIKFFGDNDADSKMHAKTIWEGFCLGERLHGARNCFGTRLFELDASGTKYKREKGYQHPTRGLLPGLPVRSQYVWEDYTKAKKDVENFGFGLLQLGCKAGDNLGILAVNRTEWMKASLAFYSQSMRTTSLYATLGNDAVEYICAHAELEVILIEKKSMKLITAILEKVGVNSGGKLKTVIQMDCDDLYQNVEDTVDPEDVKSFKAAGVTLIGFSEVVAMGMKTGGKVNPPKPDDVAFVMYTSGTTGMPKGAILTHKNIMCSVGAMPTIAPLSEEDFHLSYLPLAHVFETLIEVAVLTHGGAIGFSQGNVSKLVADFCGLRPTILCGVPRVFQKVYQRVFGQVDKAACLKKWFFNKAYTFQCGQSRKGLPLDEGYDKKVFSQIRGKVGLDRTRIIITGAAPCPPYLMEFLRVVIKCDVMQGYGMTESAAAISVSLPKDPNVGHVGPPVCCNMVKLVSVPEMNYKIDDKPYPRGEIVIKGDNVFAGYYKNDKATKETVVDGWLHTGDIGRFNPNGTISIIDRKKNIFKMSQGEYIAAEKIEMAYSKSPFVGQIWIYGNSFKSFVLAVVVPNAEKIVEVAVSKGWWPTTDAPKPGTEEFSKLFNEVCEGKHKDEIKKMIQASLGEQRKNLKGFEVAKDIIVESRINEMMVGFTEENQCMTPTFKLRRPFLLKRYCQQLMATYEANGEKNKPSENWPGLDKQDLKEKKASDQK